MQLCRIIKLIKLLQKKERKLIINKTIRMTIQIIQQIISEQQCDNQTLMVEQEESDDKIDLNNIEDLQTGMRYRMNDISMLNVLQMTGRNDIEHLNVSIDQYLSDIKITNSNLRTLTFLGYQYLNLKSLNLSCNKLTTLKLSNQKDQQTIPYSNNSPISYEQKSWLNFPQLLYLHLQCNLLRKLPQINLKKVIKIDISKNKIVSIDKFFENQYLCLEQLNLYQNYIENLPLINAHNLQCLYATNNKIASINDFGRGVYSKLKTLDLSFNKLKSIPTLKTPLIQKIDLSNNSIKSLNKFGKGEYLQLSELFLQNNMLTKNPLLRNCPQITNVSLEQVASPTVYTLTTIFPYLITLNLTNCNLSNIQLLQFTNHSLLQVLNLEHNLLQNITCLKKTNLNPEVLCELHIIEGNFIKNSQNEKLLILLDSWRQMEHYSGYESRKDIVCKATIKRKMILDQLYRYHCRG